MGSGFVAAVAVRRGLAGYPSMLDNAFVYVPSDAVVPDSAAGDLADRAELLGWIEPAIAAYKDASQALELGAAAGPGGVDLRQGWSGEWWGSALT